MRDFELDATRRGLPPPVRETGAPEADVDRPLAPARSPALDAATVMRLQRTVGNAGVVQLLGAEEEVASSASPVHDVVGSGGGTPLDAGVRSSMESAFGQSFEDVRVHTGDTASKSAESVGANAYTVGSDVVFRSGQFDPGSSKGQRTLAHELAHVVQQSQGPVDGTAAPGGIRVSDPSDRFERAADQTADEVLSSVQASRAAPSQASSEERGRAAGGGGRRRPARGPARPDGRGGGRGARRAELRARAAPGFCPRIPPPTLAPRPRRAADAHFEQFRAADAHSSRSGHPGHRSRATGAQNRLTQAPARRSRAAAARVCPEIDRMAASDVKDVRPAHGGAGGAARAAHASGRHVPTRMSTRRFSTTARRT